MNQGLNAPETVPTEPGSEYKLFLAALNDSVRKRVANIPEPAKGNARVAVLFSGGVDCTLLTFLLHQCVGGPNESDVQVASRRRTD